MQSPADFCSLYRVLHARGQDTCLCIVTNRHSSRLENGRWQMCRIAPVLGVQSVTHLMLAGCLHSVVPP